MRERTLWHPVCRSDHLPAGQLQGTHLLGERIVLWRDAAGAAQVWADRCPHRGSALSLGCIKENTLHCAYHGWQFAPSGQCVKIPADPEFIPITQKAQVFHSQEAYGMVWACLDAPASPVPPFPEFAHSHLNKVHCGPYEVATSAPRIVENFLDMAHFGYVHTGILGDLAHTAVPAYEVSEINDARGTGILASRCMAWQPKSNASIATGSMVEYSYRVVHPYGSILTKVPAAQNGFDEAIALLVLPLTEETSRAWFVLAMTDFSSSDDALRHFQDTIFAQDKPIIESQWPKRLPLDPRAEMHTVADKMSAAYRRWLQQQGVAFGCMP
jgi:phenylpropionate dioxygenase-like ring-hydroxylating dioxygenase large terminal subunit